MPKVNSHALRWSWLTALVASTSLVASPLVPLRDTGLVSQDSAGRGCAFVGAQLYCWSRASVAAGIASINTPAEWVLRPDRPSGEFEQPVSLAASDRHCVVDAAGLWCWGENVLGQLGFGDHQPRPAPTRLQGLPADLAQVALGSYHGCALTRAGEVWCWGRAGRGAVGPGASGSESLPGRVTGLPGAAQALALGNDYSCALADGEVWCWGDNRFGQLGDGGSAGGVQPRRALGLPPGVRQVAAGREHACARDALGAVWCWGSNGNAATGVAPSPSRRFEVTPQQVALPAVATGIHLGDAQSCALAANDLLCWGRAADGAMSPLPRARDRPPGAPADWLGHCYTVAGELRCPSAALRVGSTVQDARPAPPLPQAPVELALGRDFACARLGDGSVWCWGGNSRGQLGQGDLLPRGQAVRLPLEGATRIAAGVSHACAVTTQGLWCWGGNDSGALGDGTLIDRTSPVRARFGGSLVSAGDGFTCAAGAGQGLRCWGRDQVGQVSGVPSTAVTTVAAPLGDAEISELSAGLKHACAVAGQPDGTRAARCWGVLPTTPEELETSGRRYEPRPLVAGAPLPAGATTLLRSAGFSSCAGDRCYGLLYLEDRTQGSFAGRTVTTPMAHPVALALGGRLLCAQGAGTDLRCTGLHHVACNYNALLGLYTTPNQFGSCTLVESLLPPEERGWLPILGLPAVPALLTAGEEYACALADGKVWCWGPKAPAGAVATSEFGPVLRNGAIEPTAAVALPLDPTRGCPAYVVSSVSLLDPAAAADAGAWGQELLLDGGRGDLNGGLNFGGFGTAQAPPVPGYAAFSIGPGGAGGQAVVLELTGDGGEFDLVVESTRPPSTLRREVLRERLVLAAAPQRRTLQLADGFHIVVLRPVSGTRLFLARLTTMRSDGGPAAFQGGAVVGGYLAGERTGFAGVCTDDAARVRLRTEARTARGAIGAGDLRLRVSEGQTGALLYDSGDD